jgi:ribonucleoside-triphosphate reductase (thioredoxin)
MVKVLSVNKIDGKNIAVDLEVNGSNSYQMVLQNGTRIVSHNSVSLLAGATPGVHWPISRYYIRRVRLMNQDKLIPSLLAAGLKIEPCYGSEKTTVVVEFPIKLDGKVRTQNEVSIWEKMHITALIQKYWADNQVSVTIDFDREKEGDQIEKVLDYFQYDMKSVSFLPRDDSVFPQMPYEAISEEKYNALASCLKPLVFDLSKSNPGDEKELDIFCDGDTCTIGVAKTEAATASSVAPAEKRQRVDQNAN